MRFKNEIVDIYKKYIKRNKTNRPTRIKLDQFNKACNEKLNDDRKLNIKKAIVDINIDKDNIFNIISNFDQRYNTVVKSISKNSFFTSSANDIYSTTKGAYNYSIISNIINLLRYASNEKHKIKVEIKNNIKDFLKIGEYKVDNHSCFRIGHQNESHKLNIIKNKNAFILFFKDENNNLLGRCLGQFVKNGVVISNFYVSLTTKYHAIIKYILNNASFSFFEKYFNKSLIRSFVIPRSYLSRVYKNDDAKCYIFKK
jgi:hypothetical protein